MMVRGNLESHSHEKLNLARCSGSDLVANRRGALPEVQIILQNARGVGEVGMIQDVESRCPKLKPVTLSDHGLLGKAEIELRESGTASSVTRHVA